LAKGILLMVALAATLAATSTASADDAVKVQRLFTQTEAWSAGQLRVAPPPRVVREVGAGDLAGDEARVTYAAGDVAVTPALFGAWAALTDRNPIWSEDAIRKLIHESLHLQASGDPLNEGAVDAVAFDLTSGWIRRFLGERPHPGFDHADNATYPAGVRTIRLLSNAAAGCGGWRSYAARVWRRAYLLANDPTRVGMAATAGSVACPGAPT